MHTINPPKFSVISKRKSKAAIIATLYLRISFENKTFEKSLGIQCNLDDWIGEDLYLQITFEEDLDK